ncbi:MAG: hypothetical protein HOQ09_01940 [Gemmatimonadaceae bacterium]|nr:hypothetical protein [Gemmatimonadaceae bacterium]
MRIDCRKIATALAVAALTLGATRAASAQGKSREHPDEDRREQGDKPRREHHDNGRAHEEGWVPPGQAKKMRSPDDAVIVARDVLGTHGYDVVRVEQSGDDRILFYRRRVKVGKFKLEKPLTKMYLRPRDDRFVIERAPNPLVAELRQKLAQ